MTKYIVDQLSKHKTKRYGKRRIDQIKRIVVHHFAGNITIDEAAKYHVSKGWPGIGYWAVIDLDGTAYITNDIDTVSYNVANGNTPTVGIALRGNWEECIPPVYMLDTLTKLIWSVQNVVGPLPVYVHSDFVNTKCPGDELRNYIKKTYPEPAALTVSETKSWFRKLFCKDKDHA